jgi:hypothetical protein
LMSSNAGWKPKEKIKIKRKDPPRDRVTKHVNQIADPPVLNARKQKSDAC